MRAYVFDSEGFGVAIGWVQVSGLRPGRSLRMPAMGANDLPADCPPSSARNRPRAPAKRSTVAPDAAAPNAG
jgi:hypothetical protein